LITGASGTLGRAFARICEIRGLAAHVYTRSEFDICDEDCIVQGLDADRPWALINAAGYVRVDDAERDGERCYAANSRGAALLAAACAERRIPLLTFSSDLVFDGLRSSPYVESDTAAPLNIYGLSKAAAERAVLQASDQALIVRTSAFFGPWDEANFITCALRALQSGKEFSAADDVVISPTYVPDLVNASLDLLIDGEHGLWHLVNRGGTSWLQLAQQAARLAKVSDGPLKPCNSHMLNLAARRPRFSVLTSERGLVMPALEDALERYIAAM
jgi:dTDP-4-dehydrorhamnose reductase